MSSFNGQNLFDSAPHRFHIGGLSLRHALHQSPGGQGVQLSGQGVQGRSITQIGDLVADSPRELRELADAIEAQLDGLPHELVDSDEERFDDVVMLAFEPGPVSQVAARWHRPYRIQYLQLAP